MAAKMGTPAYVFDLDAFADRCAMAKHYLGDISLTYSMKANPFLLGGIPDAISHIEVCSPGELAICKRMGVKPENIIYSGVMKEAWDVEEAVSFGVDLLTAESKRHVMLENSAVLKLGNPGEKRKVILRLTSGNQFGMSEKDILELIEAKDQYPGLDFYGLHYYSGTQKKMRQIKKDFQRIEKLLEALKQQFDYEPRLIEYGPGANVDYFEAPYNESDRQGFEEVAGEILAFARRYPVGIEMGRFLACDCGHFITSVKDIKESSETNYLICDGGIHHLKYHGQTMAMQVPPITVIKAKDELTGEAVCTYSENGPDTAVCTIPYTLCGSLCTVADILVREVMLAPIEIEDRLVFHRCGAYSVTEGTMMFLSRTMPQVWSYRKKDGFKLLRDFKEAADINIATGF